MLQRHRPSERRNLKRRLYIHARWRLTSAARLWVILLAPMQNHPSLRKSYPRCNDPAKRGSVCEAFEKKPLPLALTLLLRYRYRATRPTGQKLWAIIGRLTGLTASELVILASCRGMGAFQAMPGVIVTTSSTMKCCDGNCVRRWPLTSFGPYPHTPLPLW